MKPFTKRLALVMGLLFTALSSFALLKAHDESYLGKMDSEPFGQSAVTELVGSVQGANFTDLRPRELGVAMSFSTQSHLPALSVPIPVVIISRAEKQMHGICASRMITGMKDALTVRNGAEVKQPGATMCRYYFASETDISIRQFSAVCFRGGANPAPAITEGWVVRMWGAVLQHFRPETILEGGSKAWSQQHPVSQLLEAVTI